MWDFIWIVTQILLGWTAMLLLFLALALLAAFVVVFLYQAGKVLGQYLKVRRLRKRLQRGND